MTTITIENSRFPKTQFVDEKEFLLFFLDYLQDLEDRDSVKREREKKQESYDFDEIRNQYV